MGLRLHPATRRLGFLWSPVERVDEINGRLVNAPSGESSKHALGVDKLGGVVPMVELVEELVGRVVVP